MRKKPERGIEKCKPVCTELLGPDLSFLVQPSTELIKSNISKCLPSIYNYRCMVMGTDEKVTLLSLGVSIFLQFFLVVLNYS